MDGQGFSDFELKGIVLKILETQPTTAYEIHLAISSQYNLIYHNLRSELNYLKNAGYIYFASPKRPHTYALTDKGRIHAQNPTLPRTLWQERLSKLIERSMENNENVREFIRRKMDAMPTANGFPSPSAELARTKAENANQFFEINELKAKISLLESELQQQKQTVEEAVAEAVDEEKCKYVEKVVDKQKRDKEARQRERMRRDLAKFYAMERRGFVDKNFFAKWGNVQPYWISNPDGYTIEILSYTNKEIERGHAVRPLTDEDIRKEGMRIKSRDIAIVNQLTIGGSTMKNTQLTW